MDRTEINARVVTEFGRLLAEGNLPVAIAARLGITPYVAGLLAQTAGLPMPKIKDRKTTRRVRNAQRGVDAATIRSIQRMLAAGLLNHSEIARETGVSSNFVDSVARGERPPRALWQPTLDAGESFLHDMIRCRGCGGQISVVPCRACRAQLVRLLDAAFSRLGFGNLGFIGWKPFSVMLKEVTRRNGGMMAQDVLTTLSAELAGFLEAADKRGHLIERCEHYYDVLAEPAKPGRNATPVMRGVIRPLVGQVFDGAVRKLESQDHAA